MSTTTEDDYDGESILEVDLIDDPEDDGQTRIPLGETRYGNETSGFSLKIRELHAVHGTGTWDCKPDQPASLLILRIKTIDSKPCRGRRIKNVVARLRFKSVKEHGLPEDDPYIVCFAPAQEHKIGLLPTSLLREKHHNQTISFDVDANPAPVVLGSELGNENSWQWTRDVWATLAAEAHQVPYGRGRLGDNVVHWTISENERARQIMDTVDVGILLRRPNDLPFTVDFSEVKVTVDWRFALAEAAQEVRDSIRRLVGDESVPTKTHTYDPATQGKLPAGVTDKNLNVLEGETNLEKFTFMHILQRTRGIKYDGPEEAAPAD